jgi:hypothetical protein
MNLNDLPENIWDWPQLAPKFAKQLFDKSPKLFSQYCACLKVNTLKEGATDAGGSGLFVLEAVAICAAHDLPMPVWLSYAFLKRYRTVVHYKAKTWDDPDAFGPPHPKGTRIAAKRKERLKSLPLSLDVEKYMNDAKNAGEFVTVDDALRIVGIKHGIGETLAAEYYYAYKANFKPF